MRQAGAWLSLVNDDRDRTQIFIFQVWHELIFFKNNNLINLVKYLYCTLLRIEEDLFVNKYVIKISVCSDDKIRLRQHWSNLEYCLMYLYLHCCLIFISDLDSWDSWDYVYTYYVYMFICVFRYCYLLTFNVYFVYLFGHFILSPCSKN